MSAEAERIARHFHEVYEELAPEEGYKTREQSAVPWEVVPAANKRLMVRTVDTMLRQGWIQPGPLQ